MYALIDQNNKVADVSETQFDVHPNLMWVVCDNSVKMGFEYNSGDGSFIDTTIKPLTQLDYEIAIKELLASTAFEKNYDSEISIVSYRNSQNATWTQESATFIAWRDNVWTTAYQILADVEAEIRPAPTIAEFLAEMPTITWP